MPRNLTTLREMLPTDLLPFCDTVESLKKFKKACCVKQLEMDVLLVIKEFAVNMAILHEVFKVSYTNKTHIIIDHVPEYIRENKLSLGQTSDQLIEACHQYVNKRFQNSHYKVNNVDNPQNGSNLLKGLNHINAYNSLTK